MIAVCQQPNYFPWIGYFEQIAQADSFVFLDSVQWIKQGRQHRSKLPSPHEKPYWLSLPVHSADHRNKSIKEMQVQEGWAKQHWQIVQSTYRKMPLYSEQVEPMLRPFFEKHAGQKFLLDICQESLFLFWDLFSLKADLHWSSDNPTKAVKTERLVELCEKLGATQYYSALGSTRYLEIEKFRSKGIEVRWQHLKLFYPSDLNRPTDYSIIDWLAQVELSEIQKILNQNLQFRPLQAERIPDHGNRA